MLESDYKFKKDSEAVLDILSGKGSDILFEKINSENVSNQIPKPNTKKRSSSAPKLLPDETFKTKDLNRSCDKSGFMNQVNKIYNRNTCMAKFEEINNSDSKNEKKMPKGYMNSLIEDDKINNSTLLKENGLETSIDDKNLHYKNSDEKKELMDENNAAKYNKALSEVNSEVKETDKSISKKSKIMLVGGNDSEFEVKKDDKTQNSIQVSKPNKPENNCNKKQLTKTDLDSNL